MAASLGALQGWTIIVGAVGIGATRLLFGLLGLGAQVACGALSWPGLKHNIAKALLTESNSEL